MLLDVPSVFVDDTVKLNAALIVPTNTSPVVIVESLNGMNMGVAAVASALAAVLIATVNALLPTVALILRLNGEFKPVDRLVDKTVERLVAPIPVAKSSPFALAINPETNDDAPALCQSKALASVIRPSL